MIDNLPAFFTIGGFWTTLVLVFVLLFSSTPVQKSLRNYDRAKYIMAFGYLLFAIFNLLVITGRLQLLDSSSLKASILILFTFQLFLFTHVSLILINYNYWPAKLLIYQLVPVSILSLLILLSNLFHWSGEINNILFLCLLFFFVISLLAVSRFFFIHYKKYRKRVENYFSGVGTDRLKWIQVSYLFLLISGVIVIFATFVTPRIIVPFYIVAILFYIGYAVHFLNYRNIFSVMRPVLKEKEEIPANLSPLTFSQIEKSLENWERQKLFTNPGITIVTVAAEISTNRSYLSQYINRMKNKTFNDWINGLRIDEAKKIMTANKKMTIEEIGERAGYTDKSYFSKCFAKYTGMTPTQWKEKQQSSIP